MNIIQNKEQKIGKILNLKLKHNLLKSVINNRKTNIRYHIN